MNGKSVNDRLASKDGRAAKLASGNLANTEIVRELYLATVSREPDLEEMLTASVDLHAAEDRRKAEEDLLWALLNSKEFLFNH